MSETQSSESASTVPRSAGQPPEGGSPVSLGRDPLPDRTRSPGARADSGIGDNGRQ